MGVIRKKLEELDNKIEDELAKSPDIHKDIRYDLIRLEKLIFGLGDIIEKYIIDNKETV